MSRSALNKDFTEALAKDFEKHGKKTLEALRAESPAQYLTLAARLLPKAPPEPKDDRGGFALFGEALARLSNGQQTREDALQEVLRDLETLASIVAHCPKGGTRAERKGLREACERARHVLAPSKKDAA